MKEDQLKPCPFCGGIAEKKEIKENDPPTYHIHVVIKCKSCGGQSGKMLNYGTYDNSDLEYAINLWNKRSK